MRRSVSECRSKKKASSYAHAELRLERGGSNGRLFELFHNSFIQSLGFQKPTKIHKKPPRMAVKREAIAL